MYAVIEAGGSQHKVTEGCNIKVDLMKLAKKGDDVVFDRVLMIGGDNIKIGKPLVENAKVHAIVTDMGDDEQGVKDKKIIVFKQKRRKGYKKAIGHRQRHTELKISKIES